MSARILLPNGLVAAATELLGYSAAGRTLVPVVLLVEPSWVVPDVTATLFPDKFDEAGTWVPVRVTTPTAHQIRETAVVGTHQVTNAISAAVGPITSLGVDMESVGGHVGLFGLTSSYCAFDPATMAMGAPTGCTAAIANLGAGRARCTIYPTVNFAAGNAVNCYLKETTGGAISFLGDVNKGINLYNFTINQVSCAALLNANGEVALAQYLDRLNFVMATKSAQPVIGYTWNGRTVLIFSGANYLTCNALAALVSGTDIPWQAATALTTSTVAATQSTVLGVGNSADGNPVHMFGRRNGAGRMHYRRDAVPTAAGPTCATGFTLDERHVQVHDFSGTQLRAYKNGTPDANNPMACDVGNMPVDRCALGGRTGPAISEQWGGLVRGTVIGLRTTPLAAGEAAALSNLLAAYSG